MDGWTKRKPRTFHLTFPKKTFLKVGKKLKNPASLVPDRGFYANVYCCSSAASLCHVPRAPGESLSIMNGSRARGKKRYLSAVVVATSYFPLLLS